MFVISGVSGHTGSVVAASLLARRLPVRVIVRDAQKGERWKREGAEVAVANLDDVAALTAALEGADGVYALVPPNFVADDPQAAQERVVDAWAAAVAATKPKHVVLLSSIGADLPEGTGNIATTHRAETKIAATGVPLTSVRASYFMENWGHVAAVAKGDGLLPTMITADRPVSMVATADIGRVAAEALVEGAGAPKLIELAGPRDYSPDEVAAIFARALGRPVKTLAVPEAGIEPALVQTGVKPKLAALFREMYGAFNRGHIAWRGQPTRGRVGIEDVVSALVA